MLRPQALLSVKRPWRRVVDFPLATMLIAILVCLAALTTGHFVGQLIPAQGRVAATAIHGAINITLLFAAYKLVIARLGERPRDDLPAHGALRDLGLGLVGGFLIFCLVVGVAAIFGFYKIVGYGGTEDLVYDAMFLAIIPGFIEELLFRGVLFRWIEDFCGSWAALLISSLLFGLSHILNPNATWFAALFLGLENGILRAGAYMLRRTLWLPIGLHAAWNFTQGFIFDAPVSGIDQHGLVVAQLSGPPIFSGGAFGLEASLIAFVIVGSIGVWLVLLAVRRGELVQPWWIRPRQSL